MLQIWDLKRVELNKPVKIARLCIIENANAKPKRIAVTNCHFHDGLNCGIDCKGAHEILIANNVVERTRVSGIAAAEDHWWGEGGMGGTPCELSVTSMMQMIVLSLLSQGKDKLPVGNGQLAWPQA